MQAIYKVDLLYRNTWFDLIATGSKFHYINYISFCYHLHLLEQLPKHLQTFTIEKVFNEDRLRNDLQKGKEMIAELIILILISVRPLSSRRQR